MAIHFRCRPVLAALFVTLAGGALLASDRPAHEAGPDQLPDDATLTHVLNRISFGPRQDDLEKVRSMGVAAYIERQLHPDTIDDSGMGRRLKSFTTLEMSTAQIARDYFLPALMERRDRQQNAATNGSGLVGPGPGRPSDAMRRQRQVLSELTDQKLLRATYSERQLQEVLVDFWFNHFNVFAGKGPDRMMLTEYEREAIRPNVLGKFRDLLGATAHSPAMLFYLDNWLSSDPRQRRLDTVQVNRAQQNQRRMGLNENYARELMELHTLGVDGGYTQKDVIDVARAFTGWTLRDPRQGGGYIFNPRLHDDGEKHVLGHTLRAGGGEKDGEQVLDILARHPSTARFIATKLARRFVGDDPPPALIERAAARFLATDGDLREVVRTILISPEFFAPETRRAKVKTPLEFVASAVRASGARVEHAAALNRTLEQLGMPPYFCQPPTGYADRADAWVNTGSLVNRMNFALALVNDRLPGVDVDLTSLIGQGDGLGSARNRLVRVILQGDVSDATMATLGKAVDLSQLAVLILGSPEFQRR